MIVLVCISAKLYVVESQISWLIFFNGIEPGCHLQEYAHKCTHIYVQARVLVMLA
jgi:hypothetical protein